MPMVPRRKCRLCRYFEVPEPFVNILSVYFLDRVCTGIALIQMMPVCQSRLVNYSFYGVEVVVEGWGSEADPSVSWWYVGPVVLWGVSTFVEKWLPRSEYLQDLGFNQDNEGFTLIRHDLERRDGSTKSIIGHVINGFNGFLGRAPAGCSVLFSFK